MKRYLVTGGTGFIGNALVKGLIKEGYHVRVLDNGSRGSLQRLEDCSNSFDYVQADIRDAQAVDKACQNMDGVIHLACVNGTEFFYQKPDLVLEVAVKGIMNIMDACRNHGVKELITASSSEVYHQPSIIPTPEHVPMVIPDAYNPRYSYAGGKLLSELITVHYGGKFLERAMIFRPHNVYGPDMGFEHVIPQLSMRMAREVASKTSTPFLIQGNGEETRAFIYIDDFTKALLKIIKCGKHMETYNIGSMEEVSIKDITLHIAKILGKTVDILPGELREGGTLRRCPDTTKMHKELDFSIETSLDEGLKKTVLWYANYVASHT